MQPMHMYELKKSVLFNRDPLKQFPPTTCFVCICITFLFVHALGSDIRPFETQTVSLWLVIEMCCSPRSGGLFPPLLRYELLCECMLLTELGSGLFRKRDQTGLSDERDGTNTERKSCHCAAEIRIWKLLEKCRNHAALQSIFILVVFSIVCHPMLSVDF